jgi:hypothetical protein
MSGFDSDSDRDPDTDEASPVRSMKQSKTRNRFGIKNQDISTADLLPGVVKVRLRDKRWARAQQPIGGRAGATGGRAR